MAKEFFTIEGAKEAEDNLRTLGKALGKNILKRILIKRAEPFAATAKAHAPVDKGQLAGSLEPQDAIGVKLTRRQRKLFPKESTVEVYVGPGTEGNQNAPQQGIQQEFGNAHHPPQPFMRPAWDAHKRQAVEGVGADLGDEIEKVRARIARKAERLAAKNGS